jgi:transcriptional regulator with XRE-family HTH domain
MSPAQCKAARGFLGWSQRELGRRTGYSFQAISRFERGERLSISAEGVIELQAVLEDAGIVFLEDGERVLVGLRRE